MNKPYYQRHVFFCTNQKAEGKKCCQNADAEAMSQYAKQKLKVLGLDGEGKIRVSKSGCLGRCDEGPCLVVYPEQTWYTYHDSDDIDRIIEQDLQQDEIVTELQLPSSDMLK